jgi:hypothetical protein
MCELVWGELGTFVKKMCSEKTPPLYIRWVGVAGTSKTRFHRVSAAYTLGTDRDTGLQVLAKFRVTVSESQRGVQVPPARENFTPSPLSADLPLSITFTFTEVIWNAHGCSTYPH